MNSVTTSRFRKLRERLPGAIRTQSEAAYSLWKKNPSHPSLRFKKIHTTKPIYSVRISLNYRALGLLEGDTMIWFWIGNHNDYDQLLNSL